MAPKSMHSFVANRNASQEPRPNSTAADLDDLKTVVPSLGTKDDKKHRSKHKGHNGRITRSYESISSRSTASSADAVSTTASTSRPNNGGSTPHHHLPDRPNFHEDHPSAAFGGTEYSETVEGSEAELPHYPVSTAVTHPTPELKFRAMLDLSRKKTAGPTIAETQIKGDSYPPTSLGIPSVSDHGERLDGRLPGGQDQVPIRVFGRPVFHSGPRKTYAPTSLAAEHQASGNLPQESFAVPSGQPKNVNPLASDPAGPDYDAAAGFSFAPAPAKKDVTIQAPHAQRSSNAQRPVTAIEKMPAPQRSIEPEERTQPYSRDEAKHVAETNGLHGQQSGRRQAMAEPTTSLYQRGRSPAHQSLNEQAPVSHTYMEQDSNVQFDQHSHNESKLDYEPPELYGKELHALQTATFDQPPDAQPFTHADVSDNASLVEKVERVAAMEPGTQVNFFASLDIDEWEEAGDWFLDQFGDTLKKLKQVRREKRKAALAFEREIEEREAVLHKKRFITQEALDGMKTSGVAVLQGTPRKGR
ncbi:hypothetical protein WHR41_08646 [Cladosporium halotolerans]|uniref:Extracellular mutant protein 11 C-terminal domain-containing protein n=1 Tax=Cladosporium halotolerans TaxID=1052096 RepID=A0AB34KCJ8_9PEZI